jgi:hypothetical protein
MPALQTADRGSASQQRRIHLCSEFKPGTELEKFGTRPIDEAG